MSLRHDQNRTSSESLFTTKARMDLTMNRLGLVIVTAEGLFPVSPNVSVWARLVRWGTRHWCGIWSVRFIVTLLFIRFFPSWRNVLIRHYIMFININSSCSYCLEAYILCCMIMWLLKSAETWFHFLRAVRRDRSSFAIRCLASLHIGWFCRQEIKHSRSS